MSYYGQLESEWWHVRCSWVTKDVMSLRRLPSRRIVLFLANIVISRTIRDSDKSRNCGCQHIDLHSTKDIMPQWWRRKWHIPGIRERRRKIHSPAAVDEYRDLTFAPCAVDIPDNCHRGQTPRGSGQGLELHG